MNRQFRRAVRRAGFNPDAPQKHRPDKFAVLPGGGIGGIITPVNPETMNRHGETVEFDNIGNDPSDVWTGVTIDHWVVGPRRTSKKNGHEVRLCFSYCGSVATYEPWEIASGRLPKTCRACRPGEHSTSPFHAVIPECDLPALRGFWEKCMATAFEETVKVTGKEAHKQWSELTRPCLADICDSAGYGRHFGWKVIVFDCAVKSARSSGEDKLVVRVKAIHVERRQIEMMIRAPGTTFEYQINLSTGRTDFKFLDIAKKIKDVVEYKMAAAAKVEAVVSATPETNGHAAPAGANAATIIDLAKLAKLQGGLSKLLLVGKDINEIAGMKLLAAEKLRQAEAKLEEREGQLQADASVEDETGKREKYLKERVEEIERNLRNTRVEYEIAAENADQARKTLEISRSVRNEAARAVETVRTEVAEVARIEEEQLKTLGDQKGLQALLAALSNIPG